MSVKPQQAVRKETRKVALGTLILTAAMLGVFALLGHFNLRVALGGLYGWLLAVGNFFLLGLTVQRIAETQDAASQEQVNLAKLKMRRSYMLRMLGGAALLVLGLTVLHLNWIACFLPLTFPQLVILAANLWSKRGRVKDGGIKE